MYGEVRQVLHPRARDPIVGSSPGATGCRSTGRTVPTLWPAPSVPGEGPLDQGQLDPDSLNTYKTSLDLIAKDRPGLAMDVTTVMATAKMNILGMTVNVLPDGYTKMNLVVEVRTRVR